MSRLWKSLSRRQRFCAVVLVLAGVVSVAWTLGGGARGPYQPLLETSLGEKSVELRELLSRFEKEKIDWYSSRVTDGRVTIEVRAGADYQSAVFLAAEQGFDFGESTTFDSGLFGVNPLVDSSDRLRMRLEHSRVRTVERSIGWYPNVESVHLVIQRAKPGRYARDTDKHDSAAVILRLKDGVSRLPAREATTIRKLVASAFTISEEHIQVVDDSMRDYSGTEEEPVAIENRVDLAERIKEVVTALYRAVYDDSEFRLGVLVDASQSSDGDGSSGSAGHSRVRINLVLDVAAVKRVLARRDLLIGAVPQLLTPEVMRRRLDEYEAEQARFLGEQIPVGDVQAVVKSEVFQAAAGNVPSLEALVKKGTQLGWGQLGLIWAGSFVTFLFLSWSLFRRRSSASYGVVSPVEQAPPGSDGSVGGDEVCVSVLDASRRANTRARECPEVAASVVRFWLDEVSTGWVSTEDDTATDSEATDDSLSGARKAAVLLLSIDESEASALLAELCESEVQILRAELVSVGVIDQVTISDVVAEFEKLASSETFIAEQPAAPVRAGDEAARLLECLRAEQPQTSAVVLAHVAPALAAAVLAEMPEEQRVDLVQRIATLQGTHDEVLRRLEGRLSCVLEGSVFISADEERGGAYAAAEILRAGGESSRVLVESLARRDTALARSISRRLFEFEDLFALDDRSLRVLLGEVDGAALGIAASTTEKKIRSRIVSRMTRGEARAFEARKKAGRAFTLAEVEKARRSVTDTALRLAESGEIRIVGVSSMAS